MATADAAVCLAHGLKVPCLVVTVESLRLLNAAHAGEKGKREAAERALKAHKALAPIECPPDATPFGWGDLLKAGGIGAAAAVVVIIVIATGSAP